MQNNKDNKDLNISSKSIDLSVFHDNNMKSSSSLKELPNNLTNKIKCDINKIYDHDTHMDNYLKYLIKAYEAFQGNNYLYCIEILKLIVSSAQSVENFDIVCENLLNISVIYSLKGNITKAFQYIHESHKLLNKLITKEIESKSPLTLDL